MSFSRGGKTVFHRLLTGILPLIGAIFVSLAVILITTTMYFDHRHANLTSAQKLVLQIRIDALEMRREQDEFLLQDLKDRRFYETGTSQNIVSESSYFSEMKKHIAAATAALPGELLPEMAKLQQLLETTHTTFSQVTKHYRNKGAANIRPGTATEDAESTLLRKFYEGVIPAEALTSRITAEIQSYVDDERSKATLFIVALYAASIMLGFFLLIRVLRAVSKPLVQLTEKVARFRETREGIVPSNFHIKELRVLDETFCETARNLGQTQQQLLQAQKMESIGTLAGGIAHDFNNLLAGILAYAGLLKKRFSSDPRTSKEIEIIEQSAERGAELTRQLLGFARKGSYEKTKFDINKTILECKSLLYRTLDKTITIKVDLAKDLDLIEGDPGQVLQTLMNLGVNARDAMPEGGELLVESQVIEADEHFCKAHGHLKPGRYVRISISDTGTGMPKQIQEKIFDPFFTTKEVGKGTGLGLSMAYGIMQNHRGLISVYSEVGHGTQFHLYFPSATMIEHVRREPMRPVDSRSIFSNRLEGQMILIVDDEALIRNIAKDILEPEGATLFFATNGEEALEFLEKNHSLVNLVLLDVIMPKMDGTKALREIKKLNPSLPVLLSSGYAESNSIARLRQEFKTDFIQKPYKADALIALITKHIRDGDASNPLAA